MNGWIKLHRKITESPVFDNSNLLKLWLWCLCKATHTEHEVIVGKQIIKLLPGQFVFGRLKAAEILNMNDRTVYDYMKLLNKLEMISMKTNNKFTLVTIVNWAVYQGDANELQQQNSQQFTICTTQETAIENNIYDIIKEDVFSDNGISKKYSGITLEKITHVKGQENAISIANRFLANYAKNSQIKGFALGGGVGSGKTFIVAALVNQFCELWLKKVTDYEKSEAVAGRLKAKAPIRFISHIELLESLKSNSELITKYKKAKIFVIDDLGAARNTEWAEERLFEIIDFRYNEELPTIFTTNLTSEELKEKISNRIYDRLLEMCDFVGVTAPSQRLRVAKSG